MKHIDVIQHTKKRGFLVAFAQRGIVSEAAEASKVHRTTHYEWLKTDPDYAEAFEVAKKQYIEKLEAELDKRALAGKQDPHSHILLMFRLKKLDPRYRDGAHIQVNQNQAIQVNNMTLEERRARVKAMIKRVQAVEQGKLK